ncbi:Flo5p [Saccharomyces cerevisiae x Saccharomyces kudriavzevii VIN7]|uniref:Flo5p n=1 Tax=Saccharomyces cerevisiae x Saccharomyces kudriavzevii (strain VIN7) TaxID=1095631 RepID=H0GXU8_SACCK|nr:Flo5p [Saccharomyces cerevisiae x Saccharomyces kudriavzevii VIN7]
MTSAVSSSKAQEVISRKISSGSYRDRTTVQGMTSVITTTGEQTTLVTVTSCKSHICTETASPAVISTVTTTLGGVTTQYTTWCPISTTESKDQTTLVTVTSCESGICSETASPAVVSTATTTINGVVTDYTTWCPLSTTEPTKKTTLVTVTSCESGICSETASPAIISTATTTINDVVTVYSTWAPQGSSEAAASTNISNNVNAASTFTDASNTETASSANSASSLSGFDYHTQAHATTTAANTIDYSNTVSPVSETANTRNPTASKLSIVSQQPHSASPSGVLVSSTASLEMSTYAGVANGLLANSALSVFIASGLLAIL